MRVTKKIIKEEFAKAESDFEFCWKLLVDLKTVSFKEEDFVMRLITFQDKLAMTIFRLQSIRVDVVFQEKKLKERFDKNNKTFNFEWYESETKRLAVFKKGIESVVHIAKALGDAYAYFFYQQDLELLSEHLSHQRIINDNAGRGERGELEFLKNMKQVDGYFTLFHGITNILRYGDFSFIDIKKMKIVRIGELKTQTIDQDTINLRLFIIKRMDKKLAEPVKTLPGKKHKKERQLAGIVNFLNHKKDQREINAKLSNDFYYKEVEQLVRTTTINTTNTVKVSNGLAFACLKFHKSSLYNKIFIREKKAQKINAISENITEVVKKILKADTKNNSVVLGSLLYNPDFTDKATPGTAPLFWMPIDNNILKELYLSDCFVISIFNPIHLIEEIEKKGFIVQSKYGNPNYGPHLPLRKGIQSFDLFISYIINSLYSESFVIDSISEAEKHLHKGQPKAYIVPQQIVFPIARSI